MMSMPTSENAQLALDTILQKPTKGIPSWLINPMEHSVIEQLAGVKQGEYVRDYERVYIEMQKAFGTCMLDQYIPDNPLSMGSHGYESADKGPTTGADKIIIDGMTIDSPEAAAEHMERFLFTNLRAKIAEFDEEKAIKRILKEESEIQSKLGDGILKCPYGHAVIPTFEYDRYGYVNYFMAFALYPELVEQQFSLQADYGTLVNKSLAKACKIGNLPPLYRIDFDMADSRGTLTSIESLEKLWFPHFARCIKPLIDAGIKLIWHCDGNLMQMIPRLLEVGLSGFQGFQYEDGMDYEKICKMKTKNGEDLIIIAGVSVTRTLPMGTPDDVKREIDWLVANGPKTGLFLGASSSIAPGVPWENIQALKDGLNYYRTHGRG